MKIMFEVLLYSISYVTCFNVTEMYLNSQYVCVCVYVYIYVIYFWLHGTFVGVCGLCVAAVGKGYSLVVVCRLLFSRVCLIAQSWLNLAAPCTVACQAPLSMGFSRQEYWGELPFLTQESNSRFLHCRPSELRGKLSFHSGVFLVELGSRAPLLPGSRALA